LVTANRDPNSIGALNEPGTRVIFGAGAGGGLDYGTLSGGRVTLGGWIDSQDRIGLEGSGFLLERGSVNFQAASAGGAAPVVSIPFNATAPFGFNPAGETSLNAGGAANAVVVHSGTRLWGAEANGVLGWLNTDRYYLRPMVGFRYLDLAESLDLTDTFFGAPTGGTIAVRDAFHTRNQFYGGQLGARAGLSFGRLTADVTAKVALGSSHEVLSINGASTVTNGAFGHPTGTTPGGVFAEPSNIGRFSRDAFAVVPEAQLQLGYAVSRNLRAFVGYTFLYESDVLRPGNQMNRNINPTQNVLFGQTGGVLTGPPAPLPQFHRSDFWAQGVSFGLGLSF
jgi:hypothetical protein